MKELTPKQLLAVERRWKEWEPSVLKTLRQGIAAGLLGSNGHTLDGLLACRKKLHRDRMVEIYSSGLGGSRARNLWPMIRRRQLDNPLWAKERFRHELTHVLALGKIVSEAKRKVVQSPAIGDPQ